jgi:serine beta-lactamase-like protein LACTB, mitochondrial
MRSGRHATRALLFYALITLLAPSGVVAQNAELAPEKRNQIETAVTKFMSTTHAPGVSVGVVENNRIAWSQGFGFADLENSVPATSRTLYRLASLSKPITAVAALQLVQEGKLDLDAPVQKYCPAFPQKEFAITTRQLLGHLGGIRHYKSESQEDPESGNTTHFENPIVAGLKFFADDPLVAKPGTKFSYSTQGFTLVGCVIEGASREKYVAYVEKNVFARAQMGQSVQDDLLAIIPYRTRFYQADKSGKVENANLLDPSYKVPGGGWLSSADDMMRFELAMLTDRLISRASRDLIWTPQHTTDGKATEYGLGWGIGTEKELGVKYVGHSGGQQGTSTFMMLVPERQAGIIVLVNMEDVEARDLAMEVMRVLLGHQVSGAMK